MIERITYMLQMTKSNEKDAMEQLALIKESYDKIDQFNVGLGKKLELTLNVNVEMKDKM